MFAFGRIQNATFSRFERCEFVKRVRCRQIYGQTKGRSCLRTRLDASKMQHFPVSERHRATRTRSYSLTAVGRSDATISDVRFSLLIP